MFWFLALAFLLLWVFGKVGAYAMGTFVHVFLALALASVLVQVFRGRRSR